MQAGLAAMPNTDKLSFIAPTHFARSLRHWTPSTSARTNAGRAAKQVHNGRAARQHATGSLTTELMFKAVEVAAGTLLSNAVLPKGGATTAKTAAKAGGRAGVAGESASVLRVMDEARKLAESLGERLADGPASSRKWTKLAVCVLLDLVGSGGLGVPGVADVLDVFTAPVSALVLHALFGNALITSAGFVEEMLPGTDGLPTATLAWFAEHSGYLQELQDRRQD